MTEHLLRPSYHHHRENVQHRQQPVQVRFLSVSVARVSIYRLASIWVSLQGVGYCFGEYTFFRSSCTQLTANGEIFTLRLLAELRSIGGWKGAFPLSCLENTRSYRCGEENAG